MKIIPIIAAAILGTTLLINQLADNVQDMQTSPREVSRETYPDFLLPDLRVTPSEELYIESGVGFRSLRFNTTFINQGKGPLEIRGESDVEREITKATQIVTKVDGGYEEIEIGEFVFHSTHEHWHTADYIEFQLWRNDEDNNSSTLIATTEKMSFCIRDEEAVGYEVENAADQAKYVACDDEIQGLSIGWSDTYKATVDGQVLDILNLEDGTYLIRAHINPYERILEIDYSNNVTTFYIEISGNTVRRLDEL